MPALPPVPGVLRCDLIGSYGSDLDVVTRFYLAYTGTAPTNALLNTFSTAIGTTWNGNLASIHPASFTLTNVDVVDLTSATSAVGAATVSHVGTLTGGELGASTAILINFHIARRYRGGKPRIYLPGGSTSEMSTIQTWSGGFITNCNTAWSGFITGCSSSAPTGSTITGQVNVSYYSGFASVQNPVTKRWRNIATPRTTPLVDVITSISTNPKIGSQRRRNLH